MRVRMEALCGRRATYHPGSLEMGIVCCFCQAVCAGLLLLTELTVLKGVLEDFEHHAAEACIEVGELALRNLQVHLPGSALLS